jgi:hypothetical protein
VALVCLGACSKEQPAPAPAAPLAPLEAPVSPPAETARAAAPRAPSACSEPEAKGFADPGAAYAAYAGAINAGNWCGAIRTFAPDARPDVALANFKSLVLAAGADNPKRAAYQARLTQFCTAQRLSCGAPESTAALAQGLLLRMPMDAELAEIRALSAEQPEQVYMALMRSLAEADPAALGKFELPLRELEIQGEHATGKAPQAGGRVSALPFVKSAPGWMLAAR